MYTTDYILQTNADFDNAIWFQFNVSVYWPDGEILDYGGVIESHTDDSLRINGEHYFKATVVFKVR
jgi:hypothetical protein